MSRQVAAVALVLCLSPAWLSAQSARFTVSVTSADVHKFPSIGSPVIAHASKGRVLDVRRELGSWVAIAWPGGDNDIAYLHVTTGSIARGVSAPPTTTRAAAAVAPQSAPTRRVPPPAGQPPPRTSPRTQPAPNAQVYVTPPPHLVGVGARVGGSMMGVGASVRAWRQDNFGYQLTASHVSRTSSLVPEQLTSTEIEPSLLYAIRERVSDYVWVRPFVGSGVNFRRQTLRIPGAVDSFSETVLGVQTFGGAEFALAPAPRFALSTDLSYRWAGSELPLPGYDLGGLALSISGHWYLK
jgi:hypothetical protein